MTSWHSYTKILALGHAGLENLFNDVVLVEEKLDGSQFSFGIFTNTEDPSGKTLMCRSKGAMLNLIAPESLFVQALETVTKLAPILNLGWTYRAEYFKKPKHNTLAYNRIPKDHLIIFDVNPTHEAYLPWDEKKAEADRLGLECVPRLYEGMVTDEMMFRKLLDTDSVLGGQKIEGVVIKNYKRFGLDGKAIMGKFVSEAFKEIHGAEWKESNPKSGDIIQKLIERYRTPARWSKAVQHLKEKGQLENSPRDIGHLINETKADIEAECKDEMIEILLKWAMPNVLRGACGGIAEWYKDELVKLQFSNNPPNVAQDNTESVSP
jgi:hypothetical protein